MPDVFISYSRKDKDFVRRLDEVLKSRGRQAWVDWEDIRPTEEWMQAIYGAIEAADTFIFVLTPDSVASMVCAKETAHAAANNKRMVPIVARDVNATEVSEALAKLNWIFFRESDDFDKATDALISALDTDLNWVHAHTRLLTDAIEWNTNGKSNSFVLHGDELRAAERWLAEAGTNKEPRPTALQTEYIIASRKAATRRQRMTLGAVTLALIVAILLAVRLFFATQEARAQQARAVAGRNRADGVIDFVQNNLTEKLVTEKLRSNSQLELMRDVGSAVDGYYDAMKQAEGESVDTLAGKAWVLVFRGLIDANNGRFDQALPKQRSAVALAEQARRLDPTSNKALEHLAGAQFILAASLASHGEAEEGIRQSRAARQSYESLVARDPSNVRWQTKLASSYDTEGNRLYGQKQFDDALSEYRKAYAIREKLVTQAPTDSKRLSELASSHEHIGKVLLGQQQFDPALAEFQAGQEIVGKLTLTDPNNAALQRDLAFSHNNIGQALQGQDQLAAAAAEFREHSEAMERLAASDPANTALQQDAAVAHALIGEVLARQKQFEEALSEFRQYHAAITKIAVRNPDNADLRVLAAASCAQVALANMLLQDKGNLTEASQLVQQGLNFLTQPDKNHVLPPQSVEIRNKLELLAQTLAKPAGQ